MGTIVKRDRVEYKRPEGDKLFLLPAPAGLYTHFFKRIKMAELKAMIILSNILGIPLFDYTLWKYRDWETDRKSTRLNSSHSGESRMPSSA